jgi:transposase
MSQGTKQKPEPTLFLITGEVYEHIPKAHFYEQLDQLLDLSFVYELTRPLYAHKMGRPSLDPVVFFKCMLVGFFENIVYDTELEFRIADSLLLRKFLGYSLSERTPDESTLRKTRQKMPEEAFGAVFAHVLDVCLRNGMLKGRAVGMDGTVVDANASMDSLRHRELGCTYEEYVLALRRQDNPAATMGEAASKDKERAGKASNSDWESTTDPEARITQHSDGHTHLSYKLDATGDLETGAIVAVGADLANVSDQADCLERLDEAIDTLANREMEPVAVVLDKGHHSGENLVGIEERGVVPLVSSPRRGGTPGFGREDFEYEPETDTLTCPAGQMLARITSKDRNANHYKARGTVCKGCPDFGVCTKSRNGRTVSVSIYEDVIKANRERVHSEDARPLMQIRRQRGERPFGYFKQFGGMRRLAGRGLSYATKKTLVAGIGWNLLLLVKTLIRDAGGSYDLVSSAIRGILRLLWRLVGVSSPEFAGNQSESREERYPLIWQAFLPNVRRKATLSGGC